jgi:hypothetical protein
MMLDDGYEEHLKNYVDEDKIPQLTKIREDMQLDHEALVKELDSGSITFEEFGEKLHDNLFKYTEEMVKVMGPEAYEAWSGVPA